MTSSDAPAMPSDDAREGSRHTLASALQALMKTPAMRETLSILIPEVDLEKCTFCGKSRHHVESLIAGPPGINICNECVDLCNTILLED